MNQKMAYHQRLLKHLEIVDVVSEYLQLQSWDGNTFIGRCPFHYEETASFVVTPDDQTFYCLSCGKNGDALDFLHEIHALLRRLSQREDEMELSDKRIILCRTCCECKEAQSW